MKAVLQRPTRKANSLELPRFQVAVCSCRKHRCLDTSGCRNFRAGWKLLPWRHGEGSEWFSGPADKDTRSPRLQRPGGFRKRSSRRTLCRICLEFLRRCCSQGGLCESGWNVAGCVCFPRERVPAQEHAQESRLMGSERNLLVLKKKKKLGGGGDGPLL